MTLVGNSLGCLLALRLSNLADRLILTAPPFDFDSGPTPLQKAHLPRYIDALYSDEARIEDLEDLRKDAESQLKYLLGSRSNLRHIRRLKREAMRFVSSDMLPGAGDNVVCVLGAQDHVTPPMSFSAFLRRRAPDARLVVIPGCGHAVPLEQPGILARLLEAG